MRHEGNFPNAFWIARTSYVPSSEARHDTLADPCEQNPCTQIAIRVSTRSYLVVCKWCLLCRTRSPHRPRASGQTRHSVKSRRPSPVRHGLSRSERQNVRPSENRWSRPTCLVSVFRGWRRPAGKANQSGNRTAAMTESRPRRACGKPSRAPRCIPARRLPSAIHRNAIARSEVVHFVHASTTPAKSYPEFLSLGWKARTSILAKYGFTARGMPVGWPVGWIRPDPDEDLVVAYLMDRFPLAKDFRSSINGSGIKCFHEVLFWRWSDMAFLTSVTNSCCALDSGSAPIRRWVAGETLFPDLTPQRST